MSEKLFEYWIGLIFPADALIPIGYESLGLPYGEMGICWFKSSHPQADIYFEQKKCVLALKEAVMKITPDSLFFERYVTERYKEDSDSKVILDVCQRNGQSLRLDLSEVHHSTYTSQQRNSYSF